MVVFRYTVDNIPQMLDYVGNSGGHLKLQLIQFMPELVDHREWSVDIDGVKAWLAQKAEKVIVREMHHRLIYLYNGTEVEVVDPVYNEEFCLNCHRIRLTHDGKLKGCLNRSDDLIPTRGLDDEGLRAAFRACVERRMPYYGAYVKEFPTRNADARPIELPTSPAG